MKILSANTIIYCRHWQSTVHFYRDRLGLPVSAELDWFIEFSLNDGARLSIANEMRATIKSSKGQGLTITLEVEDIDAVRAELVERGLLPTQIRTHAWGAKVMYLVDPEGNRLEYWSGNQMGGLS